VSSGMSTVILLMTHSVLENRRCIFPTLSGDVSRSENERWAVQEARLSVHPQCPRSISNVPTALFPRVSENWRLSRT
jgi:hypothetical protein